MLRNPFCLVALMIILRLAKVEGDTEAFMIGLLPQPIYEKANVTWPVPPPSFNEGHSIKVAIKNFGDTSDDVGFHTFLPDYAEMTSFTMNTDGIAYSAKKTTYKEGQELMQVAREQNHNAALYVPQPLLDRYDSEIQTAKNTVHIKAGKEMIFDMQYKETLQDMMDAGVKVLNRARVAFDLYGATVEQMVGELYSPNYPNSYPNSADITWWVRVPEQNAVLLQIVDLDIEECCDRLTLYDGNSIHEKVIAVISGSMDSMNNLTVFQSTTNSMFLHLTSDCSESKSGFKAVSTVAVIGSTTKAPAITTPAQTTNPNNVINSTISTNNTVCTGTDYLTAYSGYNTMASINYPNGYYNNLYCTWRITSYYSYYVIKVLIDDIDVEYGYDYLRFYDGSSNYYPDLSYTPTNGSIIYSTGMYMFISFETDHIVTRKGFQLRYKCDYQQTVTTETYPYSTPGSDTTVSINSTACIDTEYISADLSYNIMTSINYPNGYYNNMYCTWMISTYYVGHIVEVIIDDIELESCCDFLKFYDGQYTNYPEISPTPSEGSSLGSGEGSAIDSIEGSTVRSTDIYMFITFQTDSSITSKGFQLRYKSDSGATCTGTVYLTANFGYNTLTSINYPNNYYNNLDCTWRITAYYSYYVVKVVVDDIELETCCDSLEFYDGQSINYPPLYPSLTVGATIYSSQRYMFIRFRTDYSVTRKGFQLRYISYY